MNPDPHKCYLCEWEGTTECESCEPTGPTEPTQLSKFDDYCILAAAFILALPFMILWCIVIVIDWLIEKATGTNPFDEL